MNNRDNNMPTTI